MHRMRGWDEKRKKNQMTRAKFIFARDTSVTGFAR